MSLPPPPLSAAAEGETSPAQFFLRPIHDIQRGKKPMPTQRRTNWSTTTSATSACISKAISGTSLMPPGTEHSSAVMASREVK